MANTVVERTDDNHIDDHVDDEIQSCFDKSNPKCFFTYAGAGSGKTRSLVNTLDFIKKDFGSELSAYSKQVAVITYTNAACDEILNRVEYSSIFFVSTIHSFLWDLIRPYQHDIRTWLSENILLKLKETEEKEAKGRKGTPTSAERLKKIEKYKKRLEKLYDIRRFTYNPNGENVGYDSLDHSEVIKIGSEFIQKKSTMQKILVSRFPIILIDESQDTKKELVDALLTVADSQKANIVIGMFGDTMQKVYLDGKDNLASCIPDEWMKPTKVMNHRSTIRVVQLANAIRSNVDDKLQFPRSDAENGTVHLFISDSANDKMEVESFAAKQMAILTKDLNWKEKTEYQRLILEHHMAASRLGFLNLFAPLYANKKLKQSVLDGSLPELRLFSQMVLPTIEAHKAGNRFVVARIAKKYSPLLLGKAFSDSACNQLQCFQKANQAVLDMCKLFDEEPAPTCLSILQEVDRTSLFEISERVTKLLTAYVAGEDPDLDSLHQAFSSSIEEMVGYCSYINGDSAFATHQGVKGLEYPRVMVIMDDVEAGGFLFSYEKLFGAQEKSDTDLKNESERNDNSISRTRRLFYVACTRAQKDLALIAYTQNKEAVRQTVIANKLFSDTEIEFV